MNKGSKNIARVAKFVYNSLKDNKFIDCSKIKRNDIIYDFI